MPFDPEDFSVAAVEGQYTVSWKGREVKAGLWRVESSDSGDPYEGGFSESVKAWTFELRGSEVWALGTRVYEDWDWYGSDHKESAVESAVCAWPPKLLVMVAAGAASAAAGGTEG